MKKMFLFAVLGLVAAAVTPSAAIAGDEANACLVVLAEDFPESAPDGVPGNGFVCADGLSSQECDFLCGDEVMSPEGELIVVDCEYLEGISCDDEGLIGKIGEPWEGACTSDPGGPGAGLCFLISEDLQNWDSQEICEEATGAWDEGGVCGAPVPTLPRAGQAALMVILMLGALLVLNLSGFMRSA